MFWIHIGMITVTIISYLAMGGIIFKQLEGGNEYDYHKAATAFRNNFLGNNSCVTVEEFVEFYAEVVKMYNAGITSLDNTTDYTTNWDFQNAVFFCVSVITTIGYGRIAPTTSAGKGFCIVYAIIGIPIFFLFLAGIGDKIYKLNLFISEKVNCAPNSPRLEKVFDTCLVLGLGVVFMILIPAALFTIFEDWDFGTAIYFCIITLSTIGFGDYVAGEDMVDGRGWYRGCVAGWIFLGLAWWAGSLNILQKTLIAHMAEAKKKDSNSSNRNIRSITKALEHSLYIVPFHDIKSRLERRRRERSILAADTIRAALTTSAVLVPTDKVAPNVPPSYDNAAFSAAAFEDIKNSYSTYL